MIWLLPLSVYLCLLPSCFSWYFHIQRVRQLPIWFFILYQLHLNNQKCWQVYETVRQQEILYEPRKILSEEKQNELDMKLNILTCDRKIQVTYFVRSQKNPLIGQYHTIMGTVKFFDSSSYLRIDDITPLLLRDSSSQ